MLVQLLALGVALRAPVARPNAVAGRSACVKMSTGTNSYLESTIGPSEAASSGGDTRDAEPMVYGSVAPTTPVESPAPAPATPPPAPKEDIVSYAEYLRSKQMELAKTAAAPAPQPAPMPQPTPVAVAPSPAPEQEPGLATRAVRVIGPLALVAGSVAGTFAFTELFPSLSPLGAGAGAGAGAAPAAITLDEIVAAQREWGDAIVRISKTYLDGGDYVNAATQAADQLYGYGRTDVLFKPTKAAEDPFRPTGEGALSYFVGGDKITGGFAEDKGFALGPGGIGWKKVIFDNNKVDFNGPSATAMGEYYFYPVGGDPPSKVEYTFGYKRNDDGKIRIYLHHSSLPYAPH